MKVFILGGGGMLGHKLVKEFSKKFDVSTTLRKRSIENLHIYDSSKIFENINVENIELIQQIIESIKPHVVINAVGVIKQLKAAEDVVNTLSVNSIFPHRLAEITEKNNARLITISTDCVFSGDKGNYLETDVPDALDLYGQSKHFGEVVTKENCLTLRTSIIGRELLTKHSLIEWFLSHRGKKVKGYVNAIFSGFPTVCLAEIIANIITEHKNLQGLYHVSSAPIDKYTLLRLVKKAYQIDIEIEPFGDYKIDRSLNSAKFREITGFKPLGWEEMIEKMAADSTSCELPVPDSGFQIQD